MPKPRVIDGSFWNDLDMAELTRDERLLVAGMITKCADDYGRLVAHPKHLRREVFGYDEDLSVEDVENMRAHILERCRNIVLYTHNGQEYIYFRNWQKWQKIRYKIDSTLPVPPGEVLESNMPLPKVSANSRKFPQGSVEQGCLEQGSVGQSRVAAAGSLQTLLDIGMDPETAQALADEHPEANVLGWCAESRKRKLENPPGWVRSMLVRGHAPPAAYDNGLADQAHAGPADAR